MLCVVGLSHKNAPIHVRERVAVSDDRLCAWLVSLHDRPDIGEVMILSTCNRVELFACPRDPLARDSAALLASLQDGILQNMAPADRSLVSPYLFQFTGNSALRHLFRVASSLDSLVVGEPQILGQVREAFDAATECGAIGRFLGRAVEAALHTAKRVRSETQIGSGSVSVASVAVELASQIFGELDGRRVALVGAGEMAETAAKSLCSSGANLVVVNRSLDRACALASRYNGSARPWSELEQALEEADVAITSTASPSLVVSYELMSRISRRRKGRSLFLVDIAVPRDVEPKVNELDGIYLYDIDDLSQIVHRRMSERMAEAERAEHIVEQELAQFEAWFDSLEVTPTVVAFRNHVRDVLQSELHRSLGGRLKHLSDAERNALQDMTCAAVNKLSHLPTARLRQAAQDGHAHDYVQVMRQLFDLPDQPCSRPSAPPSCCPSSSGACCLSQTTEQHPSEERT